jgi:hypothetical protein
MHRRLSTLMKSSSGSSSRIDELDGPDVGNDTESKISTVATTVRGEDTQLAAPSFKVKRVDYYYSWWTRSWKYRVRILVLWPLLKLKLRLEHERQSCC